VAPKFEVRKIYNANRSPKHPATNTLGQGGFGIRRFGGDFLRYGLGILLNHSPGLLPCEVSLRIYNG